MIKKITLKDLLKLYNMSIPDFARECDLSYDQAYNIVNGITPPSIYKLKKINRVLKCGYDLIINAFIEQGRQNLEGK